MVHSIRGKVIEKIGLPGWRYRHTHVLLEVRIVVVEFVALYGVPRFIWRVPGKLYGVGTDGLTLEVCGLLRDCGQIHKPVTR